MNDHISYDGNPETQGTAPLQSFEADNQAPPAGTKATPRPAGRPRELPPEESSPATFQRFDSDGSSDGLGPTDTPRPRGREETGQNRDIQKSSG
jgi:hypothetical protein